MSKCDVSIVIVNYNTAHLFAELFGALERATQGLAAQIVVVDNASRDDSVQRLIREYPQVELIRSPANVGFGRANNLAMGHVRSDMILLLNTDAFPAPNAIVDALAIMKQHPDLGVLGARLIGRDGAEQPSCRFFPTPLNSFLQATGFQAWMPWVRQVDHEGLVPKQLRACDWVPGCFYLTRRQVIQQVGLFDPRYFLYFEEVDHCRSVKRAGWGIACDPSVSVVHLGGESAKSDGALSAAGRQLSDLQIESEWLYFRKHHGIGGVALHLLLSALATMSRACKDSVKRVVQGSRIGGMNGLWTQAWHELRLRWTVLMRTSLGRSSLH